MSGNIAEIRNLNKKFDTFALRDVGFDLPRGFITGLIGPNGAGKTTVIKLMLNMLKKDGGSVEIFGKDSVKDDREIKERVGVVMDKTFFSEEWRLSEVERVLSRFYRNWSADRYRELLTRFGLDPAKKVGALSRGMKMKLLIAAALSHGAELLILDEPTSGLDAVARGELLDLLSDFIADGARSVLFSTHITADLEKTADYIVFLCGGRLLYAGTKDELVEKYALVKGDPATLRPEQKRAVVGYREHCAGFDGLAERSALASLPSSVAAESAGLDEIIVRFTTGGNFS